MGFYSLKGFVLVDFWMLKGFVLVVFFWSHEMIIIFAAESMHN